MKYLIDTNVFIKAEPTLSGYIEPLIDEVVNLISLISKANSQIYIHPASLLDIENDKNLNRRQLRKTLFRKYSILENPPQYSQIFTQYNLKPRNDHDNVDYELLASLAGNAIDFLISEDDGIHKVAVRLGLSDRVVTIAGAIEILTALLATTPFPPPSVRAVLAYELDENDPIFDTFRRDYQNFNNWFKKCKREHRQAWIVEGTHRDYAGLCIVKHLPDNRLKICSFKIVEKYQGGKYGELLLKTVFDYCFKNHIRESYITIYEKYGLLVQLLEDFGFHNIGNREDTGESILTKKFAITTVGYKGHEPLALNIELGPQAIKIESDSCFILPIYTGYHAMLFPDYERQLPLLPNKESYSNGIKKAYVCNAKIRRIKPGATLLFYKVHPHQAIYAIGVTESILVTSDVNNLMRFVAKRTLFSFEQLQQLCIKECLGILFRQAFQLERPITITELRDNAKLKSAPQQIMSFPKDGLEWLKKRIGERCF